MEEQQETAAVPGPTIDANGNDPQASPPATENTGMLPTQLVSVWHCTPAGGCTTPTKCVCLMACHTSANAIAVLAKNFIGVLVAVW